MRNCFVPTCDLRNRGKPRRPMFAVPKDPALLEQWSRAMPQWRPLKRGDRVCSLHFRDDDVLRSFDHVIKGQVYRLARDRPRLKPNAVPCLNFATSTSASTQRPVGSSDEGNSSPMEEREASAADDAALGYGGREELSEPYDLDVAGEDEAEQDDQQQDRQPRARLEDIYDIEEVLLTDGTAVVPSVSVDTFSNFYDEVFEVVLPSTLWAVHRCPERTQVIFSYMELQTLSVIKMVTIGSSGVVNIYLASRLCRILHMPDDTEAIVDITSNVLAQLDDVRLSDNYPQAIDSESEPSPPTRDSISDDNHGSVSSENCADCLSDRD